LGKNRVSEASIKKPGWEKTGFLSWKKTPSRNRVFSKNPVSKISVLAKVLSQKPGFLNLSPARQKKLTTEGATWRAYFK
jgi:hypothetical protein